MRSHDHITCRTKTQLPFKWEIGLLQSLSYTLRRSQFVVKVITKDLLIPNDCTNHISHLSVHKDKRRFATLAYHLD